MITETVDVLLRQGLITAEQVRKGEEEARRTGVGLEEALAKLGFLDEEEAAKAKAIFFSVPYLDLSDYSIDPAVLKLVPEQAARRHKVLPLFCISDALTIAMVNARDIEAFDQIRAVSKVDTVEPVLVSEGGLHKAMSRYYAQPGNVDEIIISSVRLVSAPQERFKETAEEPPIIRLVNVLILEAVKDRASDIHLEPEAGDFRVRYRIDGILHESHTLPRKVQNAVISRIKIIAGMDIAENRKPQDGKAHLRLEGRDFDIRVSTFPTVHGENVVLRLLDKSSILRSLGDLGFSPEHLRVFGRLIRQPNGIILVTGPTGSGKTTTLYAALTHISSVEKNIITIEDPVEYELPLIRQTAVNPKAEITFANGLRSILRQDPDCIMVGEIRDKETAEVAIQASLTGHLVFSTLHTNDAPSALARLLDIGIEPFLISSSLAGVLAQRLVRTICPACKERYSPDEDALKEAGLPAGTVAYRGKGCPACMNTGFMGRIGIFELLSVHEQIRKMVDARNSADEIRRAARELGMKTLREDGIDKVLAGVTTLAEVMRVTDIE